MVMHDMHQLSLEVLTVAGSRLRKLKGREVEIVERVAPGATQNTEVVGSAFRPQPIKMQGLGHIQRHCMFYQTLDRRKAGILGYENKLVRRVFAQNELATRSEDIDSVAALQAVKYTIGEWVAWHTLNVELQVAVIARATGHRVVDPRAITRHERASMA